jgi:hypothetical protein
LDGYGIPLNEFPPKLKQQINELLKARCRALREDEEPYYDACDPENEPESDCELDSQQIRRTTVVSIRGAICRLYGYLLKFEKVADVVDVKDLFNKKSFVRYREWLIEERKIKSYSLRSVFSPLVHAGQQFRSLAPRHIWMRNFLRSIPREPEAERRKRIAQRSVSYDVVKGIPEKILNERKELEAQLDSGDITVENRRKVQIARLVMKELLIRWILVLPWRARNLYSCRILGDHPNLECKPLPYYEQERVPEWAREMAKDATDVWQYEFTAAETKAKRIIRDVVPKELWTLLNDYIDHFRGDLLRDRNRDHPFLFLNSRGEPLGVHTLYCLICEITLQYGERRCSTKIFRDIYAFEYLRTHSDPHRFKNLAIELWHTNTITTHRYYATEHGLNVAAESLIKLREKMRRRHESDDLVEFAQWRALLIIVVATVSPLLALALCIWILTKALVTKAKSRR